MVKPNTLFIGFLLWIRPLLICSTSNNLFLLHHGVRVSTGSLLRRYDRQGMTSLLCGAMCGSSCGTYHYSSETCETFTDLKSDPNIDFSSDLAWTVGYRQQGSIQDGQWTLAFRAQAGIGVPVYETWLDTAQTTDDPFIPADFPATCLRFSNYQGCDRHYRSNILNNWAGVAQVRFSLYKYGAEVGYVQFNGTGTSRESWFTVNHILSSTWYPDILSVPLTDTGISGHVQGTNVLRRFYLFGPHNGCEYDWSYTVIFDLATDLCIEAALWGFSLGAPPTIFYSPTSGKASLYNVAPYTRGETAEVMAVWVTYS